VRISAGASFKKWELVFGKDAVKRMLGVFSKKCEIRFAYGNCDENKRGGNSVLLTNIKVTLVFFALMIVVFCVQAQQTQPHLPKLSDYEITKILDNQEIAHFPLTETFLDKMERIQAELIELPIEIEENASGDDLTVIGLIRAIEARPMVMNILANYDMEVRDYVLGSMALSNALLASIEAENEEEEVLFLDEPVFASPENLDFGRRYADRIRALHGG